MTNFAERHFKAFCNEGSLWIYALTDGRLRAHVIGFYDDLPEAWIRVEVATSQTMFQKVQAVFDAFTTVLTAKYPYYTWEDRMFIDGTVMPFNEETIEHIYVRDAGEIMEIHHVWKLHEDGLMHCPDAYEALQI
jgi:hypothetical protein